MENTQTDSGEILIIDNETIQLNGQQQIQDQDDLNYDEQNVDDQENHDVANNGIPLNLNSDNENNDLLSTNSDEEIRHDIVTPISHFASSRGMPRGILRHGRSNNSNHPRGRYVSWLHNARVNMITTSTGIQPTNTVTNVFSGFNPQNVNTANNARDGNDPQLEKADFNLQMLAKMMMKLSMNQKQQLNTILQQQAQIQQQA